MTRDRSQLIRAVSGLRGPLWPPVRRRPRFGVKINHLHHHRAAKCFRTKDTIERFDPELWRAIDQENRRQEAHIELIASENYVSPAVLQAQGSVLTNKYAEGYPGKRYYGGCEFVDIAEQLAIDRAKKLFHAGYANVQPHSGAQANRRCMRPCCTRATSILGMALDAGGHLTHGARVNLSGRYFDAVTYGLDLEHRGDRLRARSRSSRT